MSDIQAARQSMIEVGRWVDQRGWCPATGGNFSVRIDLHDDPEAPHSDQVTEACVVTASGYHKGQLTLDHFIEVDLWGQPLNSNDPNRPSAETLIHVALYRLSEDIGAVLHAHSIPNTVLSRITSGDVITFEGWEMQKSLSGSLTHETEVSLAVFDNTQDMNALASELTERWQKRGDVRWGFLVRGHGIYAWGRNIEEARRHLEGIEFLLACQLELARLERGAL